MAKLTIGILTMNEERRIGACIDSAAFADQIIVVDSGSTDSTLAIAQAKGAQAFVYADWQGFAVQRNRILQHATGDWVFFLDADEVVTPALAQEIRAIVDANTEAVWEVAWEQIAYGQSLGRMRSSGGIPRLFPRGQIVQFEGVVHEGAQLRNTALPVHLLKNRLPHYSRETIYGSLQKLAQYVQLGAYKRLQAGKRGGVLRGLGSGIANFIRLYIFHRGFLCGRAGFLHSFLVALECFFRYVALDIDRDHLEKTKKR
ncbi:MAG: glycosyltransferase family 2 protein [Comamonas sp.]|nr:glycosyltransferase family 2 protein [Candidatus Comamonas equi]